MGSLVGTGIITEKNISLEKEGTFRNALRTDAPTGAATLSPTQVIPKAPSPRVTGSSLGGVALSPIPVPSVSVQPVSFTRPSQTPTYSMPSTGLTRPSQNPTYSMPPSGPAPITSVGTVENGGIGTSGGSSPAGMCPKIYAPVVGASGTVYANSCIAEQSGEASWITYEEYQANQGTPGTGGSTPGTGGEAPSPGGTPWEDASSWVGGGGGGFDMSAPMTEGPGMANYTPIAYDEQGNAIYGYSQDGTPIYGVDENGNVINDPTKAKQAKAKEMGLTPVFKERGRGFFFLIALAAVTTYVIFKK
jgi:hypothetical protein